MLQKAAIFWKLEQVQVVTTLCGAVGFCRHGINVGEPLRVWLFGLFRIVVVGVPRVALVRSHKILPSLTASLGTGGCF